MTSRAIEAVIFDMDGVLIDTEPVWRRVELGIFNRLGCNLDESDFAQTMGVPIRDVVHFRYSRHAWDGPGIDEVTQEIVDAMVAEIAAHGEPMRGAMDALTVARAAGMPIAIASSSSRRLIDAVVQRLHIADYVQVICTADDEEAGKPDPAVFLRAAQRLGVAPENCLAIEDSPNGVRAALAAGMICAVVPDPGHADHPVMDGAHHRFASLDELTAAWLGAQTELPASHIP